MRPPSHGQNVSRNSSHWPESNQKRKKRLKNRFHLENRTHLENRAHLKKRPCRRPLLSTSPISFDTFRSAAQSRTHLPAKLLQEEKKTIPIIEAARD